MNKENFKLVLDKIEKNRDLYDQKTYHNKKFFGLCGNTHCVAGWAQILSGQKADNRFVYRDGRLFLGLNRADANYLFDSKRTIEEIYDFYETGKRPTTAPKKKAATPATAPQDQEAAVLEAMVGMRSRE